MGKRLKLAGLVFGGIIAGLICAEAGARVLYPRHSGPYIPHDRAFYTLKPGWRGRLVAGGRPFKASVNELGLRGPDRPAERDGKTVILCVGDSFTFGMGVDDDETFPAQLGSILGKSYVVHNGGVAGYNLSQEYSRLLDAGGDIRPHIVVLAVFANDWEDLGYTTYIANEAGELTIAPRSMRADDFNAGRIRESWDDVERERRSFLWRLLLKSRLAEILHTRLYYIGMRNNASEDTDGVAPGSWQRLGSLTRNLMLGKSTPIGERAWSKGALIIAGMDAVVRGWDGKFMVMAVPMEEQLSRPELALLQDKLAELLEKNSIPFLDLSPLFRNPPHPEALYLPGDGHLTVKGNERAAKALAEFIKQSGYP